MARRLTKAGSAVVPLDVIAEEPLEIHLDGVLVATTSRTPGHDFELAVGHCHGEGMLADHADVQDVRYCATGSAVETGFNVVSVGTSKRAGVPRAGTAPTGPVDPPEVEIVGAVAAAVDPDAETAVAFAVATGEVVVSRADMYAVNALSKVVGRLVLDDQVPAHGLALFLTSRPDATQVRRASAAGLSVVVGALAPSSAAVAVARDADIVLARLAVDGMLEVLSPDPLRRS